MSIAFSNYFLQRERSTHKSMENKENSESRLQKLLIKDWFSEQPGNIITKKVCVINDKTLFYYIFIGNGTVFIQKTS